MLLYDFFPTSYLGLPLGAKLKDKSIWGPIVKLLREGCMGGNQNTFPKGGH